MCFFFQTLFEFFIFQPIQRRYRQSLVQIYRAACYYDSSSRRTSFPHSSRVGFEFICFPLFKLAVFRSLLYLDVRTVHRLALRKTLPMNWIVVKPLIFCDKYTSIPSQMRLKKRLPSYLINWLDNGVAVLVKH